MSTACFPYIDIQAIMAEGKQHALAVGLTTLSTDDMLVYPLIYCQLY